MQDLRNFKDEDLQGLTPEAVTALAQQMLLQIQRQAQDIRLKDAKLEKLTFELARHKAWKFGAKVEAMSAEQRRLFEETLTEDEAALEALLKQAQGTPPDDTAASSRASRDAKSAVAEEALRRIAEIYRVERELSTLTSDERLSRRSSDAKPLWADLHAWLRLERGRVPEGSSTAKALNVSALLTTSLVP